MSDFTFDADRRKRLGFPEIIYGEAKSVEQLNQIIATQLQHDKSCLVTRLQAEKAEVLNKFYPDGLYDKIAQTFFAGQKKENLSKDDVAILSAGTSDVYLVKEIANTLEFLGYQVGVFQDIGVAGLHRFTERTAAINKYKVLIVVAGFEGALASIVGGLFRQPIIAVPSSIGYGVGKGGHAALNSMLASCANGITVVNIDGGYTAALATVRILQSFD